MHRFLVPTQKKNHKSSNNDQSKDGESKNSVDTGVRFRGEGREGRTRDKVRIVDCANTYKK